MKKMIRIAVVMFALSFPFVSGCFATEKKTKKSIVKIYTTRVRPFFSSPWQLSSPSSISGSGCIIKGDRILTNAHVVGYQTHLQVSRYGKPKKFKAKVLAVSHETDLALLTVENKDFFRGAKPLSFGKLPEIQEEVVVYGYPKGGDTLSLTRGVISRIEHQRYAHSSKEFLAIQIDAAVNPGNSGGPAMTNGKVIGVVMQYISDSENIGYIVPTPVINHFLKDLDDGRHDGFPESGIIVQNMENLNMKTMYGLKKTESGALVTRVIPGSPAEGVILPKDIILSIGKHNIADDATVEFRPNEWTSFEYYMQHRQIGEKTSLEILRLGKKRKVRITLNKPSSSLQLVPESRYDVTPAYYIYGGLLFAPLTLDYIKAWGKNWQYDAPPDFLMLYYDGYPSVKGEEVINMIKVLPHQINNGYHDMEDSIITQVNGIKVLNLRELVNVVEKFSGNKLIEFKTKEGRYIVLNRKKAEAALPEILKTYGIPADRYFEK